MEDSSTGSLVSVMDKAICLIVSFGGFGLTRKTSTATVTVNAEKSMLALSKRLLRSPEYDAIRSLDREVKEYLKRVALPSIMKSGSYLVPIPLVEEVEQKLQTWRSARIERVEAFLEVYPAQSAAVQAELRDLYDPRNYPSCESLRQRYSFDWQYVDFGVPGRLKAISARLFEAERDKASKQISAATDEIKQALRSGFADLVGRITSALGPAEDGKRKVLKQAAIDNLNSFMQIFEMRNIADDKELAALVTQARSLMAGKDRAILKDDDAARQQIAEGFQALSGSLQTMTIERGARAIDLEDDEPVEAAV